MAWTSPLTAVANTALTAAQWNATVRDNLNETAPAKATTASSLFVATGANAIAERIPDASRVVTPETTTSTTYTNLTTNGPAVTVVTGTKAIVSMTSRLSTSTAGAQAWAAFAISGATTVAAQDDDAILVTSGTAQLATRQSYVGLITGLTPGSNTFTMQYRVSAGTGSFSNRQMMVIPL